MVIQVLPSRHCQSQNVIRHGTDANGTQRYLCHDCRRTFREQPKSRTRPEEFQSKWLKKASRLPPLAETLVAETLAPARLDDVLELDEL